MFISLCSCIADKCLRSMDDPARIAPDCDPARIASVLQLACKISRSWDLGRPLSQRTIESPTLPAYLPLPKAASRPPPLTLLDWVFAKTVTVDETCLASVVSIQLLRGGPTPIDGRCIAAAVMPIGPPRHQWPTDWFRLPESSVGCVWPRDA